MRNKKTKRQVFQRVLGALVMSMGFNMTVAGMFTHSLPVLVGGMSAVVVGLFISIYDEL